MPCNASVRQMVRNARSQSKNWCRRSRFEVRALSRDGAWGANRCGCAKLDLQPAVPLTWLRSEGMVNLAITGDAERAHDNQTGNHSSPT